MNFSSLMHATCPHFILLGLITLITFGEADKLESSFSAGFYSLVLISISLSPSHLSPIILLSTVLKQPQTVFLTRGERPTKEVNEMRSSTGKNGQEMVVTYLNVLTRNSQGN
jgi:hypothetical protein